MRRRLDWQVEFARERQKELESGRHKCGHYILVVYKIKTSMELILKTMLAYIYIMSGIRASFRKSRVQWQTIYQDDVNAMLGGDQTDAVAFVDKMLNLNYVVSKRAGSTGEDVISTIRLYDALLEKSRSSLTNEQLVRTKADMKYFGRLISKQLSERKAVQLRRLPALVRDDTTNPGLAAIEMHFLQNDVITLPNKMDNRVLKNGQFLRELFSTPLDTCFRGDDNKKGGGGGDGRGSCGESDSESMDFFSQGDGAADDDAEGLDAYTKSIGTAHMQQMNNILRTLEGRLENLSDQMPQLDDHKETAEKVRVMGCLTAQIQKYLKALYEAGEAMYSDAAVTLDPDLIKLDEYMKKSSETLNFLGDISAGIEEGTEYIMQHVPLVSELLRKMFTLQEEIDQEYQKFLYVQSQSNILSVLLDSQAKDMLSTLQMSGTVLFNCIPYDIVPVLYNSVYSPASTPTVFDKYMSVRNMLAAADRTFFVQLNNFVVRPLEELMAQMPLIEPDPFFDNSQVVDRYKSFYVDCVSKMFALSQDFCYRLMRRQHDANAPAAQTTAASNSKTPQPKQSYVVRYVANEGSANNKTSCEFIEQDKELPANVVKYVKCVTSMFSATQRQRKSSVYLSINHLQHIEPTLVIEAIHNLSRTRNCRPTS
jgi:hypothetical protein